MRPIAFIGLFGLSLGCASAVLLGCASAAAAQDSVLVKFAPPVGKAFREVNDTQNSHRAGQGPSRNSNGIQFRDFRVVKSKSGYDFNVIAHGDPARKYDPQEQGVAYHYDLSGSLIGIGGFSEFYAREAKRGNVSASDQRAFQQLSASDEFLPGEQNVSADRTAGIIGRTVKVGSTWEHPQRVLSTFLKKPVVARYVVESIRPSGDSAIVKFKGEFSDISDEEVRPEGLPADKKGFLKNTATAWNTETEIDANTGLILREKKRRSITTTLRGPDGKVTVTESTFSKSTSLNPLP